MLSLRLNGSRLLKALRRALLAFDSFIDSSMYDAGRRASVSLSAIAAASERLRVRGLAKVGFDLACEGANAGLVGLLVALTLAQPAFKATADEDWLKHTDFAVTFQDRYGNEIGRRGVKHDDTVPFDELPPHLIHAVPATE